MEQEIPITKLMEMIGEQSIRIKLLSEKLQTLNNENMALKNHLEREKEESKKAKIDTIEAKHQKCREELPEKYAGKSETLKRISNLDEKIDKNRQDLDYMKGVRNGESGK